MRFIAEFNPQAWFQGYAVSVDPDGDTTWDVTRFLELLRPDLRAAVCRSNTTESDGLKEDQAAPEWVRNWSNPFYIEVSVEAENDAERAEIENNDDPAAYVHALPYVEPDAAADAQGGADDTGAADAAESELESAFRLLLDRGLTTERAVAIIAEVESTRESKPGAFVVVQEGGSSSEMYIHASDCAEDAEAFRLSCHEGSYRTSGLIEVPAWLAACGEPFYTLLEQVAVAELDYPDADAAGGDLEDAA